MGSRRLTAGVDVLDADELQTMGPGLDALAAATGAPVTARWAWLQAWVDTHRSWSPVGLVRHEAGEPVAAALLAARRRGPVRELAALGHGQSDYGRFPTTDVAHADALADAVVALLRRTRLPWRLRPEQLPLGDPVLTAVAERLPRGCLQPGDDAPVIELAAGFDPWRATRKSVRQTVRTARNRLAREGRDVEINVTREPAPLMAELAAVHRDRDHAVRGHSDLDDPEHRAFWSRVVRGDVCPVELTTLHFDGRLAAYLLALLDGPSYRVWDFRFADDLGAYSPGHLLRTEVVTRVAAAEQWREFDWMRGVEAYKLAIPPRLDGAVRLDVWAPAVLGRAMQARRAVTGKLRSA